MLKRGVPSPDSWEGEAVPIISRGRWDLGAKVFTPVFPDPTQSGGSGRGIRGGISASKEQSLAKLSVEPRVPCLALPAEQGLPPYHRAARVREGRAEDQQGSCGPRICGTLSEAQGCWVGGKRVGKALSVGVNLLDDCV